MIGNVIVPVLTKGIESKNKEIIQLCLDAFTDYIRTFDYVLIKENTSVIPNKDSIIQIVVNYITNDDITLQTNANHFIGEFSILLNKKQIDYISNTLIELFNSSKSINNKISIFNTLSSIAKSSANKQTDFIDTIFQ